MRRTCALGLLVAAACAAAYVGLRPGVAPRRLAEVSEHAEWAAPRRLATGKWSAVTHHAEWARRFAHASVVDVHGTFLLLGGTEMDYAVVSKGGVYQYSQHEYLNDIWASKSNGSSWELVPTRSDRWTPRRSMATAVLGGVVYVMGGLCGSGCYLNDVWSSVNPSVWTSHGRAPWSARHGHVVLALDSRLVLLGGHDGGFLSDVWTIHRPTGGGAWEHVGHGGWSARYGHAGVVVDGALLVLGGLVGSEGGVACRGDVWQSTDLGKSWVELHRHAFSPRYAFQAAVAHGAVWVLGGVTADLERLHDVWWSSSVEGPMGLQWHKLGPAPWPPRYEFSSLVSVGALYVLGGINDQRHRFHDVWKMLPTCKDVVCPSGTFCKEGDDDAEPVCQDVCLGACPNDKKCVLDSDVKATCIDPCDRYTCPKGMQCRVHLHRPHCEKNLSDY